ncbi:glycosyltransferase family 2 protein [Peribacillus frigoritolerans]|uniref:glycosyltransferase family 2 protein n=1 Tax=Peribacillus frigoritolerans TaxID=450367 RepID=UPI0021A6DAFA|nr:glycosyltransferase family 2 protein [Peribacillus frigoritolerans]MCT1391451.1 glycosyltransferase family 2 protein [Peribacillus frigoritolerans]
MLTFLTFIFLLALLLLIYTYIVYPLIMFIIGKNFNKSYFNSGIEKEYPSLSLIIPAYNEEEVIDRKIQNSLNVFREYPGDYEIIIGSDGSSDNTNSIMKKYKENKLLKLFIFNERRGKISVLNELVERSKGEILIFTDSSSIIKSDAILKLVRNFSNKKVGGVGAVKTVDKAISGISNVKNQEGIYWKVEEVTKRGEGILGKLVGADGPLFAIRSKLFNHFPSETILDDFCISMYVAKKSCFIYEEEAVVYEYPSLNYNEEFKRRIRLSAGAFQTLRLLRNTLFPFDLLTFNFISHKILRWFSPFLMIIVFVTNCLIFKSHFVLTFCLVAQCIIYFTTFATHFSSYLRKGKLSSFTYFFVMSNLIQLKGFYRYIKGTSTSLWEKTIK